MKKKIILLATATVLATSSYAVSYKKAGDRKEVGANYAKKIPEFKNKGMVHSFFEQLRDDVTADEKQDIVDAALADKDFIRANAFMYNKKYAIVKKNVFDVEFPQAPSTISLPDYPNALKSLIKSVKRTSNPISAYEGYMIIKTYLGNHYENAKTNKALFQKVLYKHKTCEGYLSEGEKYFFGRGRAVNFKRALEVYTEGHKQCKGKSYYGVVLDSKILAAKVQLNVKK